MAGETIGGRGLLRRPDSAAETPHSITPRSADWKYVGFAEHRLERGRSIGCPADGRERAVVVLEGVVSLRAGKQRWGSLGSRVTVFDGAAPPVLLL